MDDRPLNPDLQVSVVLPTFNEADSLPVIIPSIADTLQQAGIRGEIIVVDDDSPDGTAEAARTLSGTYPVRVLKRTEERGLATAVLAGFGLSRAPVCVVMDADSSHPVSALPEMVNKILENQADIVVGSRNIPGGGTRDWPLFSKIKSKFAATLALGLSPLTDPTTGFMAVRREILSGLELDPIGWKIVLEIAVKAAPARIAEVPIIFSDRELGRSKQNLRVLRQYLAHLYRLYCFRYPALIEFIKFCIVGFIGLFVDLTVVTVLKQGWALDTRLCAVGGFSVAVTTNYLINRFWSFKRARFTPWISSYLTYVATNLLGFGLRVAVVHLLIVLADIDRGYGYLLTNFLGIAVATMFNFVGAKYFAFNPQKLAFGLKADSRK